MPVRSHKRVRSPRLCYFYLFALLGKRSITADTALRLGQWLGTGAELWLNLQKNYELRLAQQEKGEEIKRTIPTRSPVAQANLIQQ